MFCDIFQSEQEQHRCRCGIFLHFYRIARCGRLKTSLSSAIAWCFWKIFRFATLLCIVRQLWKDNFKVIGQQLHCIAMFVIPYSNNIFSRKNKKFACFKTISYIARSLGIGTRERRLVYLWKRQPQFFCLINLYLMNNTRKPIWNFFFLSKKKITFLCNNWTVFAFSLCLVGCSEKSILPTMDKFLKTRTPCVL